MVAIIVGLNLQAAKCLTEISKIDLQAETEKNAITLGSPFEKLVSTYDDYAYTLENIPFNSTEEIMKYLKPSTENQPIKNTGIYLGFPDGRAVFADGTVVPSDIDVTTRSWYQKAMADKDKNFIGGIIHPGLRVSLESLSNRTAQLPHINLEKPERIISKNTVDSMRSGILYGHAGMMDACIERMEDELGEKLNVVATGGLAPFVIPFCKHEITVDENLLLKGLRILYELNK